MTAREILMLVLVSSIVPLLGIAAVLGPLMKFLTPY
jgi:hypothetical protein